MLLPLLVLPLLLPPPSRASRGAPPLPTARRFLVLSASQRKRKETQLSAFGKLLKGNIPHVKIQLSEVEQSAFKKLYQPLFEMRL